MFPLTVESGSNLVMITMQMTEEKYYGMMSVFDEIVDLFERISM